MSEMRWAACSAVVAMAAMLAATAVEAREEAEGPCEFEFCGIDTLACVETYEFSVKCTETDDGCETTYCNAS